VSFCDLCGSLFHQAHLQEWLKGHQTCPNCRRAISISESDSIYADLVFERLDQLETEIGSLREITNGFDHTLKEAQLTQTDAQQTRTVRTK